MTPLNKRVIRKLKESKLQYIAIMVVMMVGLLVYISFNMGIYNFENSVNTYYEKNNLADMTAEVVKIPMNSINDLKRINGIKTVEGRIKMDVPLKVKDPNEKVTARIISVPKEQRINKLYLINGHLGLSDYKEAYVIEHFVQGRGITIGDRVRPQINGKVYDLKIKAEVGSPEFVYLMKDSQSMLPDLTSFGIIYVSEKFATEAFGLGNAYNEIIIDVEEGYNLEKIKTKVEEALDKYGVKSVRLREDQLSYRIVEEEIQGGKQSSSVVPLLFLVVAGIILTVMISRLVKGDRMTIGVLKSMGYTNMQVLIHYSKFAVFIGLFGSILGVILGIFVSKYFTQLYLMFYKVHYVTIEYYIGYLISGILLSLVFSIGAGVIGAKGTLKIVPAESMRKEPPKSGKRIIFEGSKIWKKLNFTQKMVWRNLLRDKKRVIFVAFGVAITLLVVVVPLYLFATMPQLFTYQFGNLQKMDYNIEFSKPTSTKSIQVIKDQLEYEKIEGKLEYPFEIESKWKSQIVSLIGLDKNTQMYDYEDKNERPLVPEKNFVYVSEGLAKVLGIKVGDRIKINNYIPGKDDIYVKVTGINKQNLGTNVYMDINLMREGLVEKDSINGVFLNSKDDVKEKLEKIRYISGINSIEDMSSSFEEFMQITAASISSLLFFGFILGFAIMYNTTVMTINSRLLEFSSLRILGMSKGEITGVILKENLVITVIGIIIGIPLSKMASQGITDAFSTDLYTFGGDIQFSTFLYGIGITLTFIGIAQFAAYYRIRKLNFIEALKERTT